jgi:hypothetical protein
MARKKTSRSKSKPTTLAPRLAGKRKGGSKKSKPRRTSPKVKSKPRSKATNATHPGGLAGWWESTSGETRQLIRGLVLGAIILAVLIGGGIWGFKAMEQRVLEKREGHGVTRQTVRFVNQPWWIPRQTLNAICRRAISADAPDFEDPAFLQTVHDALTNDPWIKRINRITKRIHPQDPTVGEIAIDCEFRRPVAVLASAGGGIAGYLSLDGTLLPADEVARLVSWRALQAGVANPPVFSGPQHVPAGTIPVELHYPVIALADESGPPSGADLADALALADLLLDKPYANQITRILVSPARPRCDLTLEVQCEVMGVTDAFISVFFGRMETGQTDYVVPLATRVAWLDEYAASQGGEIGGVGRYIDLRRDQIYVD